MMIVASLAFLLMQASPDLDRLNKAQQLMDSGRCAEAIPILQKLAANHPSAPSLTYGLGRCYFEVEDYAAAIAALRNAIRGMPKSAEAHFFLGSALGLSGSLPEAIQELRAAMELDPQFEPAFRAFGMFRVQQGQYLREALVALETAVRLNPRDARARYWLGRFYQGIGDSDQARQRFEQAYKLDPEDPQTRLGMGLALLADGELDQALAHFDAVLKIDPGLVPALLGRARALYNKGEAAQALAPAEAAHKGARGFEDERSSVWILSRIYRALSRDADAQAAERQMKDLETSFAGEMARIRELNDQAARYEAEHRPDKVAESLEAFLKLRENGEVLIRLGDAYLQLGRFAEAERCYVRASQIGPLTDGLKQRLHTVREQAAHPKP